MTEPKVYPRVTFGMIVLNGRPFLEYNLRALYPFAHQIIVVEGACEPAASLATPGGHSTDGTLETLKRFKEEEDPEDKLVLVNAEDDGKPSGFWTEKDEMSQAYARRATGEWLWQVDSDEFYIESDMRSVLELVVSDPEIAGVSFPFLNFWGGLNTWRTANTSATTYLACHASSVGGRAIVIPPIDRPRWSMSRDSTSAH